MTCLRCDQPAVEPAPMSGGAVSASQLYCETHLQEVIDAGQISPEQISLSED